MIAFSNRHMLIHLSVCFLEGLPLCVTYLTKKPSQTASPGFTGRGLESVETQDAGPWDGNRLILPGQKPAQQGCQGEEPVCQQ